MNVKSVLLLCIYLLSVSVYSIFGHASPLPRLLLISFDGFRHDYLELTKQSGRNVPNFDKLIGNGVYASVRNAFVTKTFPNHYTIATGLYEENHGVVQNEMYDPVFKEVFNNSAGQSEDEKWWNNGTEDWQGEAIWFANERARSTSTLRRSGVYFWPGSEATRHGRHVTYSKHYDSSVSLLTRIDHVIEWFTDAEAPINLGILYYEEPDAIGHEIGPGNETIYDVIVDIDNHLGTLIQKMEDNNLFHNTNIIITSDHGMVDIIGAKYLSDYVDTTLFDHYGHPPVFNILPKPGQHDVVYANLSAHSDDLHVFLKEDIPREHHYTYNRRILPIVVSAPKGYHLCLNRTCTYSKGNHGYNNTLQEMHPFFIGHGPSFKTNYHPPDPLNIVDIYPLMCHLLDIDAPYNDGELSRIKHLILSQEDHSTITMLTYILTVAFAATITGVIAVASLRITRSRRRRLMVKPTLMKNIYVPNHEIDSHLLASDDEELP